MGFITFDVLKHSLLKIKTMIDNKANSSHKHNPSDINTDSNNRFVTDDEKAKINVIVTDGYGNQALLDNGSYGFVGGVSIDDVTPSTTTVYSSQKVEDKLADIHTHDNKTILDEIVNTGDGTKYLTDDGTYKEGTYITQEIINEISNPLTTEPLEMLQIDYVASSTVTANTYINLSSANIVYSNMIIENGFIKLTAGKLYKINFDKAGAVNAVDSGNFTIYLCDDDSNTISLLSPVTPATNTTNRASSVSGIVLYTPTVDTYVSILSNVNLSSLFFTLTVEEVRNNPVNQYGGFQQQTLWTGELSTISSPVTLSDSISNYSHIYVTSVCDTETSTSVYSKTEPIIVENIELNKGSGLVNNFFKNPTNYYNIAYEFVDAETFQINEINCEGLSNPIITKIVGVYGELPSLIMGGDF